MSSKSGYAKVEELTLHGLGDQFVIYIQLQGCYKQRILTSIDTCDHDIIRRGELVGKDARRRT
ncbi:hypothetical protein [Natronorubrum bangense]|uniref:Uncharacterized protein n=2 Tax=Natronorubrum bangense TaxID=61858 RepID=L9WKW0_9EURY|nr:hypothetical protein [Natronorubrum bangense]ELY49866.1 hypothetical protein C494_07645 [Natronorubrum bangense JCM 10635]QCC55485.1 hypothetical protein DV706_14020 [Natronorubrum bangense]